jgi:two-component system, NtrC family, sensor kinase
MNKEKPDILTSNFANLLLESMADGVFTLDADGIISFWNPSMERITGYAASDAIGRPCKMLAFNRCFKKICAKGPNGCDIFNFGKVDGKECHFKHKDGHDVPVLKNARIVKDDTGKAIGVVETVTDMTTAHQTRIQLMQSEKMASLGKLSAGVAHQLNNPLGSITLFTKLIMEEHDLDDSAKKDLERILADAERCGDIVRELLEFARQTNHQMLPCDVNNALLRTLFLLENQTIFQNITIEKNISETLPQICANEQQLNHVFMNIILNAVQSMENKGTLKISSDFIPAENSVEVRVGDSGCGMPEEILKNIFDPFFTTREEGKGTGLGLSIVYGIMKNHGGAVTAESDCDKGSTIILKFPVKKNAPAEKED